MNFFGKILMTNYGSGRIQYNGRPKCFIRDLGTQGTFHIRIKFRVWIQRRIQQYRISNITVVRIWPVHVRYPVRTLCGIGDNEIRQDFLRLVN